MSRRDILFDLNRLCEIDERIYRTRKLPPLYESGVRYVREHEDFIAAVPVEDWQAVDVLYENGYGDCEDLACARVAELRIKGIEAYPYIEKTGRVWHVTVRVVGGANEDPSKRLGMGSVA